MTIENEGSLLASLELFEAFGQRYAESLGNRVEESIQTDGPEITPTTRAALATEAAEGALLGRTTWGGEGAPSTGCFVWTGSLAGLIGSDEKPCRELSDEDVETLESHLRLNVEEGGEGPLPVDWTTVTRVEGDALEDELRKLGIAEECEVATVLLSIGEAQVGFRFVMATEAPEEAALSADASASDEKEALAEDTDSAPEIDVLAEAADLGLADGSPASANEVPLLSDDSPDEAVPGAGSPAAIDSGDLDNLQHLLDVRMPLTIRLGSTRMNLDKLLRLAPGAILELDQREEEPLEVLANGHVIARGEVVVMDERFGLRITEIGATEERLRATL